MYSHRDRGDGDTVIQTYSSHDIHA
uniref:Uncharacterized protein n=1 Tax=Nelumbo nucifera TaxID=4432 RepID=A0A822XPP8_NELNU|nr:TPA_asm: hypothetical protein HUJ06_022359 [Nelumbo nucifera]